MVFPKARVVVAACLFLGWLGFLFYLVLQTRNPIVVSRTQLLVADACVLAEVTDHEGRPLDSITITKILWSRTPTDAPAAGATLTLSSLPDVAAEQGYAGPAEYLIPLVRKRGKDNVENQVAPLPSVPGFYPRQQLELLEFGSNRELVLQLIQELRPNLLNGKGEVGKTPMVLARNLSWREAESWHQRFKDAGARVVLADGEYRIYRATADVLAQFREVHPE